MLTSAVLGTLSQNTSILMSPRFVCRVTDMVNGAGSQTQHRRWIRVRGGRAEAPTGQSNFLRWHGPPRYQPALSSILTSPKAAAIEAAQRR